MSWPYCEGHPHCHDPRTRVYIPAVGGVIIEMGWVPPEIATSGIRLCRAHALIRFGVA